MSSFVWMKVLESAPERYDRGIHRLSRGRIDDVYGRIADRVAASGRTVLDIGCGTGGVSLACAARGARVFGIDRDAGMLEVARGKPVPGEGTVTFLQLAAAEIEDRFPEEAFDAVVSCLAFSELSPEQRAYALKIARTRLRPGGELLIADEVAPRSRARRAWYHLAAGAPCRPHLPAHPDHHPRRRRPRRSRVRRGLRRSHGDPHLGGHVRPRLRRACRGCARGAARPGGVMRFRDLPAYVRDTVLRMLPHRARTGLRRVGRPGRDAPVLVTGNFTLTVRRLTDALAGQDAFVLVADSRGINVWCAAGGGHLTHHDVISAIRTSGVADRVDHKEVILPQLSATGVERRKITEATGFETRWGPARLEDLPAFLDRGRRVHKDERRIRFPLWERMEMAAMWGVPTLVIGGLIVGSLAGLAVLVSAAASLFTIVVGVFALLPWLKVGSGWRWPTLGVFAVLGFGVASVILVLLGRIAPGPMMWIGFSSLLFAGVLSADLEGTTPWYGSYINTFRNPASVDLIEDKCTGAADCVQVCPRDVLQMEGKRRKVVIARPGQCIQCGACVVQCPESALRFRYADGSVVEAETIRRTRMNMVGKRTVQVPD